MNYAIINVIPNSTIKQNTTQNCEAKTRSALRSLIRAIFSIGKTHRGDCGPPRGWCIHPGGSPWMLTAPQLLWCCQTSPTPVPASAHNYCSPIVRLYELLSYVSSRPIQPLSRLLYFEECIFKKSFHLGRASLVTVELWWAMFLMHTIRAFGDSAFWRNQAKV